MGIAQLLVFPRCQAGVSTSNRDIQGGGSHSFAGCTPLDAPPLIDHLARDKEFYQNDEMIEEPLWLERLHELTPEQ